MKFSMKFRLLSLLLVAALLVGILPAPTAYAEAAVPGEELPEENSEESQAVDTPDGEASYVVSGEVPELREESVKHFRMDDGSFIAVDYNIPVHYMDTDENWQDIDNTLLPAVSAQTYAYSASAMAQTAAQASDSYAAVNGEDEKTFAADLSTGFLFSSQTGSSAVQMFLVDSNEDSESGSAAVDQPVDAEDASEADEVMQTESAVELPLTETDGAALPPDLAENEMGEAAQDSEVVLETEDPVVAETVQEEVLPTESENIQDKAVDLIRENPEAQKEFMVFNRSASAQISYPDAPKTEEVSFWGNIAHGVQSLLGISNDEDDAPVDSLGDQIVPAHLRSQVLYEDVYPGVDFQYELYSYNIKESILVKEPLSEYQFSFRLALDGLIPQMQEDGSVLLLNEDEESVYSIPAPFMMDDSGEYSDAVSYSLSENSDGAWTLTVTADADWFAEEGRAFPVSIDPTLIDETKHRDFNGIICNQINANIDQHQNVACGYHPTYGQMELYFRLDDAPTIPNGATLTRAQVAFYQDDYRSDYSSSNSSSNIIMYMREIQSSTNFSTLTWATRPSLGPVLDYNASGWSGIANFFYWDITPAAKGWYSGSNNYGLAMTSNATSYNHNRAWFTYTDRVYYIVSYRNTNGIESYYTYQTAGIGNAGTAYISDYTGNLTVVKELLSYASTVNPFALNLVYNNSSVNTASSTTGDRLDMSLGNGFMLSVMQTVEKVSLKNDAVSGGTTTYLKYTDGDGTEHYFAKDSSRDSSFYYDEDGLNLKITEYTTDYFRMEDDQGNKMYFVHGFLTLIQDRNGNEIQIWYTHANGTSDSNGYPNTTGDRISRIVQKNKNASSVTIAELEYDSSKTLTCVRDAAGREYTFTYEAPSAGAPNRLSRISLDSVQIARYSTSSNYMTFVYDLEAQYGIRFSYINRKINAYYEIITTATYDQPGVVVNVERMSNGQVCYRDLGANHSSNSDDILTYYSFDYAGRTVNAYTTDNSGQILGASNATYSGVGSTDKKNNRTLRTATIGVAAMNDLRDSGFEQNSSDWTYIGAGTSTTNILSKLENPRTGNRTLKGWIADGINTTISAKRSTNNLSAGYDYTFSGYVNTSQCTEFKGSGVYLQVADSSGAVVATSDSINYKTSTSCDNGWVRLSTTFHVNSQGAFTVGVYNSGADGIFFADDLQVEKGRTPSNRNLLQNGSLQYWGDAWTMGSGASFKDYMGLFATGQYDFSIRLNGDPYSDSIAYQDVPINKAGESFVLSGWAKATAVPDNVTKATGEDAAAKDNHKQFGLRAIITYSDNTTEYHYAPFNPDLTDWQYTSVAIVPKKTLSVTNIRVVCTYERNANTAYFDNISLVREAAQTMKYDNDGNLVSVKSTGNSEETSNYSGGNLTSVKTGGSGTFNYTYDNAHNLTSVSNGVVKESFTVDAKGNTTGSSLTKNDGSGDKITSGAVYGYNGNLQTQSTDSRGKSTNYDFYSESGYNAMTGQPFSVTDPGGTVRKYGYSGPLNRISSNYIDGTVSLNYNYNSKGYLTSIVRGGFIPNNTTKQNQTYNMAYDALGNMTSMSVGSRNLVQNSYNSSTGALTGQTYGNGATVSFQYDDLGRKKQTSYSGGRTIDYTYTGDGQLYSAKDTVGSSSVLYTYNYDSLGRLIGSKQSGSNIRTQYTYDTNNRLTRWDYAAPSLSTVYETYTYNSSSTDNISDGALTSMRMLTGDSIAFTYDTLSRLDTRQIAGGIKETFVYAAGVGTSTTTPLVCTKNLKVNGVNTANLKYTYNNVGNISKAENGTNSTSVDYTYDAQGQLLSAVHKSGGTTTRTETYSYDTYGNIRSFNNGSRSQEYIYGNTDWKDLLTGIKIDNQTYSLTYDNIGNPTSYFNGTRYSMQWSEGRRLASLTAGGNTTTYTYDLNGLRSKKVNSDGTWVKYFIADGKIIGETRYPASGGYLYDMRYTFDENGDVCGISIWNNGDNHWTRYYFLKSLQGDVLAVYQYGDTFTKVAEYTYDSWGNVLTKSGALADINPFRYRSYYQDTETGFYYLKARYYDPAIGRFINADEYSDTDDGFLGHNMFAYCLNNPVNFSDHDGTLPGWATKVLIGTAVIAALAVVTVATAGTGTALACAAAGALEGAVTGAAIGAASGAVTGAVGHRISTGSWKGAGQAALDGAATGYMTGAITGAIQGGINSPYCFVAGTAVLTAAGAVAIETIEAGDYVWAWDEQTGDVSLKQVVETYINETDELVHVTVAGEEIVTTPSHPFYSPVKGWTDAVNLRAGDILVLVNGEYVVVEKVQHEILETPVKVYNFQVEDYHTYYVSDSGVLVHNSCGKYREATRTGQGVDVGHRISTKQAITRLRNGEDVYASSRSAAKTLVKKAFGNAKPYSEIHTNVNNAMWHFHDANNHFYHVFFR